MGELINSAGYGDAYQKNGPPLQLPLLDDFPGPLVIRAIRDHEFDLVLSFQMFEIRPEVLFRFARARAFDVQDDFGPLVHRCDVDGSRRFDQHLEAFIGQPLNQVEAFRLSERLAAGHLDEIASIAVHALHDRIKGHPLAACESVFGVAPSAAEIASREPDEHARPAGMG